MHDPLAVFYLWCVAFFGDFHLKPKVWHYGHRHCFFGASSDDIWMRGCSWGEY